MQIARFKYIGCRTLAMLGAIWTAIVALPATAGSAEQGRGGAPAQATAGKPWSFAAIADNRAADERPEGAYEGVLAEIRDMTQNPAPRFPAIEFVVACGDLKNAADGKKNWTLWLDAFQQSSRKPCYYPVLGNWDSGDEDFNKDVILRNQKNVVGNDPTKYCVDWQNVRLIVGRDLKYVEEAIRSAPAAVQHVFVADHYPVFPRHCYMHKPTADEVEFWNMLLEHRDKVRAYLTGHTHHYSRIRVADPLGKVAKDLSSLPDEAGGIYQIDCGSAGIPRHSDGACTIVEIMVDGRDLRFRALQAPLDRPGEFRVKDRWGWSTGSSAGQK